MNASKHVDDYVATLKWGSRPEPTTPSGADSPPTVLASSCWRRRSRSSIARGAHLPRVRPLQRGAVGTRSGRRHRSRLRRPRDRHEPLRRDEQRRAQQNQDPGPLGHGCSGCDGGPVPRWSATVRLPARRGRGASEPRPSRRRAPGRAPGISRLEVIAAGSHLGCRYSSAFSWSISKR